MQLGNGLWETTNFNSLQQPVNMFLGSTQGGYDIWKLVNAYGVAGKNNGNITQQAMNASGMAATITQDYTHDGVNRLLLAAEYTNGTATPSCPDTTSQWCTQFGYDAYGNRSVANATNYSLKFGLEARAVVGVGVAVNASQAGRAYDRSAESARSLLSAAAAYIKSKIPALPF